jgi:membrane protein implicated in regulation of membrane protease activity
VILIGAILLAIYVLPAPWGVLAVIGAGIVEAAETAFWFWLSRRRKVQAGAETLIGAHGVVASACRPDGLVRVQGELWSARSELGADPGDDVRVVARDGLVLSVERERAEPRA